MLGNAVISCFITLFTRKCKLQLARTHITWRCVTPPVAPEGVSESTHNELTCDRIWLGLETWRYILVQYLGSPILVKYNVWRKYWGVPELSRLAISIVNTHTCSVQILLKQQTMIIIYVSMIMTIMIPNGQSHSLYGDHNKSYMQLFFKWCSPIPYRTWIWLKKKYI